MGSSGFAVSFVDPSTTKKFFTCNTVISERCCVCIVHFIKKEKAFEQENGAIFYCLQIQGDTLPRFVRNDIKMLRYAFLKSLYFYP